MAPLNILVTGACGVTPRAIARSLRASTAFSDATLVGADRGGNWYGFYEGLYDRVYRVSQPHDSGYPELVADICERERIDAALVGPEAEVLFWSATIENNPLIRLDETEGSWVRRVLELAAVLGCSPDYEENLISLRNWSVNASH